jgi:predicted lysophospholipase L1 biosynthesis ABC-type transport system permease subunit
MHRRAEVFVVIAAVPHIALIAAMAPRERQREIGLLISMGAKRGIIFFPVIAESLVPAAMGEVSGVMAGFVIFSCRAYSTALICHGRFSRDRFDWRNGIPGSYHNRGHIFTLAGLTQQYHESV